METIEEIWLTIPGIPGYEVSNQLRLKSYMSSKKGRIREWRNKYGGVTLVVEGRATVISVKRLYIAAKNNISPFGLDKNVFVGGTAEHPVLVTRAENARLTADKKRKMHRSTEESLIYFEQARKEVDVLIDYYRTGDIEPVFQLLLGYKSNVIGYVLSTNRVYCMDSAEEAWSQTLDIFMDKLTRGKIAASTVSSYLRGIARKVIVSRKAERKRFVSYMNALDSSKQVYQ